MLPQTLAPKVSGSLAGHWVGLALESCTPQEWNTKSGLLAGYRFRFRAVVNGEPVQALTNSDTHGRWATFAQALLGAAPYADAESLVGRRLIGYITVNAKGYYELGDVRRYPDEWSL
jgi:hypothetical protein